MLTFAVVAYIEVEGDECNFEARSSPRGIVVGFRGALDMGGATISSDGHRQPVYVFISFLRAK